MKPRDRSLTVGCIGAGGLMNQFIAYAAHLGISRFVVVDNDRLEESNLNRFLGAGPADVGMPKVDLAARYVRSLDPRAEVVTVAERFPCAAAEGALRHCDWLAAGVDNDETRLQVQLFALFRGMALVDMGSGIFLEDDGAVPPRIDESGGQVRLAVPGQACLACMGLDPAAARGEATREMDIRRGYVIGTDITPPSVIHLNAVVAAAGLRLSTAWLLGLDVPALHLSYDERRMRMHSIAAARRENCPVCGTAKVSRSLP